MICLAILLFEGIWVLGLWNGKAGECIKYCLMVHDNRRMEDSDAEYDLMNCGDLTQEVSEENYSILPRDCSCDSSCVVRNVVAFSFSNESA